MLLKEAKREKKKVRECKKDIATAKAELLKRNNISENFGQEYYREIKDNYSDFRDSYETRMEIENAIRNFDNWCNNITYQDLKREKEKNKRIERIKEKDDDLEI